MKIIYSSLLALSLLFIFNDVFGQIQYSLDSVLTYNPDNSVHRTRIVNELNSDKYEMKVDIYIESIREFGPFYILEYERHSDNSLESITELNCWGYAVGRDTCPKTYYRKYNELGDVIEYYQNDIVVINAGTSREEWEYTETVDSTIFDVNNRPIEVYHFETLNQGPRITYKTENVYSNGKIQSSNRFKLNNNFGWYIPSREETFTYDSNGNLVVHNINFLNNTTKDSERTMYEYVTHDGEEKLSFEYSYRVVGFDTISLTDITRNYGDHLIVETTKTFQDDGTFRWKNKAEHYLLDDRISTDTAKFYFNRTDDEEWSESGYRKYFYKELTTHTLEYLEGSNISIFPNPAQDYFFLDGGNLDKNYKKYIIYNALGKVVLEGEVLDSMKIDVSKIPSGIYFLRINSKTLQFVVGR